MIHNTKTKAVAPSPKINIITMPPYSGNTIEELNQSLTSLENAKPLHEEPHRQIKKKLRFDDYDEVKEIPHIADMTDEEVDDSYFSREEVKAIRRECRALVTMIEVGDKKGLRKICIRGLHQHTPTFTNRRRAIRQHLYYAVQEIQEYQTFQGINCPDMIADICREYSKQSKKEARLMGAADAKAASKQSKKKKKARPRGTAGAKTASKQSKKEASFFYEYYHANEGTTDAKAASNI